MESLETGSSMGKLQSLSNICSNDFSEVKLESGNLFVLVQNNLIKIFI